MNLDIREATIEDVPALVELYLRAYRENAEIGFPSSVLETGPEDVRQWLDERTVLVAARAQTPLGVVQIIPRPDWEVPEIGRLAVDPDYQRRGLGDRLRTVAEQRVAGAHDRVRLRTFSGHPFLEAWYDEAGYDRIAIQTLDDRPYDAYVMEKSL